MGIWIERSIEQRLRNLTNRRPAVLLTGIRQSGKSALLKKMFPESRYVTFDHYHNIEAAMASPARFLEDLSEENQVILDEVQYVPDLFRELKILIDSERRKTARWILTGSQKFAQMEKVSDSLAGRIGILELETLGTEEIRPFFPGEDLENILWKGGFPETWANTDIDLSIYIDDYISSYLEKDLRSILQTSNLRDFHRFLRSCALRCGSLMNFSDMARDIGTSPNTVKSWMNALSTSGIITLLEPWFANMNKRLAKTPKLYFNDQGILCRLLNIADSGRIDGHPLVGNIWENFVFNELIRIEGISPARNLFFYRDQNKVEVDFLIENGDSPILIEAKYAERPGKTNLPKVQKALGLDDNKTWCACRVPEKGRFPGKNYSMINPLLSGMADVINP